MVLIDWFEGLLITRPPSGFQKQAHRRRMVVTGTEDRERFTLGRGKPKNVEGDPVGHTFIGIRRQPSKFELAEAYEGIAEDLGPARAPALSGDVLLRLGTLGQSDELVVGNPEYPSLTGRVLPFGEVQLEERTPRIRGPSARRDPATGGEAS